VRVREYDTCMRVCPAEWKMKEKDKTGGHLVNHASLSVDTPRLKLYMCNDNIIWCIIIYKKKTVTIRESKKLTN